MPRSPQTRSTSSTRSRKPAGAAKPARPFTVDHFRAYAGKLRLDNGNYWTVEPFQLELVEDLFAGYREWWAVLPEGNAKTTLLGGVVLYGADYSEDPWIPIAASTRRQAEILYTQAKGFVRRSPGMERRFRWHDGYRKIVSLRNGGEGIEVYAAGEGAADGVIPYPYAVVDEGHRHRDLGIYRVWKGKLKKRGAQIALISTAGEPGTDFEETRDNIRDTAAKRERRGPCHLRSVGRSVVMHEFRVPDAKQARDLELVKQANPLSTITIADLREQLESPTLDWGEDWLRRTCSIPARSSLAAITDQEWDDAETAERIPEGESISVGLDVAWKLDDTALAPLWIPEFEKRLFGDPIILSPPRDGQSLNPHLIEDAFRRLHGRNPIELVAMDTTKAEQLASWLEEELGCQVVERGTGNAHAAEDYERFMEGLRQGWVRHTGDKGFRRHAMNAIARHLSGDRKRFDRPVSSRRDAKEQDRRVIDALTAAGMVNAVAAANFGEAGSPWERRAKGEESLL